MTLYDDSPDEYAPTMQQVGVAALITAAAFAAVVWWWLR